MKILHLIPSLVLTLVAISCSQSGQVTVETQNNGTFTLTPLTDNSIRIQSVNDGAEPLDELFYTQKLRSPKFKVKQYGWVTTVTQKGLTTVCEGDLFSFYDAEGNLLTQELAGDAHSRTFESPEGEHLYGLGQFQDGIMDVSGISRRLTQVNSQVSIPMILSSKGYGILWNSYGLTEYNLGTDSVALKPAGDKGETTVNTTSTSGSIRERRLFEAFEGEMTVSEDGDYSFLLDVGQTMARKHYLAIDGKVIVDASNFWLPPTTSVIAPLTAGVHKVEVLGVRDDAPVLHWRKVDGTTLFCSPASPGIDYTVFAGTADEVIGAYRTVTGPVPPMPEWMLGYVHCRERYDTQAELLENATTFKELGIPVDVIVQDWQWWGKYGWNSMQFDEDKYPDPVAMVDSLHAMDIRVMLSVWSKVDRWTPLGQQLEKNGYYIEGTDWIDYFKPEAADFYWRAFRDSLVRTGIDAWWFDATEPENDDLKGRYEQYRNVYPLKVLETVYNGLKTVQPEKEPVVLTRSMAPGIQRYGAICWSGDIGNEWETLRRQITAGLSLEACGLPWWTYDAGGFFRPADQYTNAEYQERMIRWIQTAVYLPVMRVHGFVSQTEPWRYPADIQQLFVDAIERREALRPYIVECARKVSEEGYTMMRPLVFDFPGDEDALAQNTEFMFGPKYLVCPVIEGGQSQVEVYLPQNEGGWKDTRDGNLYEGGNYVTVPLDMSNIPVFERLQ